MASGGGIVRPSRWGAALCGVGAGDGAVVDRGGVDSGCAQGVAELPLGRAGALVVGEQSGAAVGQVRDPLCQCLDAVAVALLACAFERPFGVVEVLSEPASSVQDVGGGRVGVDPLRP